MTTASNPAAVVVAAMPSEAQPSTVAELIEAAKPAETVEVPSELQATTNDLYERLGTYSLRFFRTALLTLANIVATVHLTP